MTKQERIWRMLDNGILSVEDIAITVGCSPNHVRVARWRRNHPHYNAEWMRQKRQEPPGQAALGKA